MKITELLKKDQCSVSFEVFPPKADTAFDSVKSATEKIAQLKPRFMSVTYGAGGGTGHYTLEIAKHIKEEFHVPVLAHMTCVCATRETVQKRIGEIRTAGICNVMALRGDIPANMAENPVREYAHAADLIRELRNEAGDVCIGGACYPETHPESADSREDILHLAQKVEAGCDFLTTQMFFDNAILYSFLYKVREAGIKVPVIPGIMPITNIKQLEKAVKLSGSFIPRRFLSLVDRFGSSPEAMKQAGIAYATDQIIDLYANGIRNVHVYTMNNADVARKIMDNLSAILG